MMEVGPLRKVEHSRKSYTCDWCNEEIKQGKTYYTWFTFGEGTTTRMHPECFNAQSIAILPDEELPIRGTYRRGCSCGETEEFCYCKDAELEGGE